MQPVAVQGVVMVLVLTQRLPMNPAVIAHGFLALTAEERIRSRCFFQTEDGQTVYLRLPRGTTLRHGDLLLPQDSHHCIGVTAKPEPVMTAIAPSPVSLLRAAYHLGNRHVPLEITSTYLRLAPDPVLKSLLEQLGLQVREEQAPFQPEVGAYGRTHTHG